MSSSSGRARTNLPSRNLFLRGSQRPAVVQLVMSSRAGYLPVSMLARVGVQTAQVA